ncbi:hypothetical protein EW146_g8639, partial [Bondarzewia mesenterica]
KSSHQYLGTLAADWLRHEALGGPLRLAHRCVEWDGWEEGLVESILGPAEQEDEWVREALAEAECGARAGRRATMTASRGGGFESDSEEEEEGCGVIASVDDILKPNGVRRKRRRGVAHVTAEEKEKEKLLASTGDVCGGRGGELGRRLEALLTVNGNGDGSVKRGSQWEAGDKEYEAEAE